MKFTDIIKENRIIASLEGTTKSQVIEELMKTFRFNKKRFQLNLEHILERESRGTTAIGEGIAIPHTDSSDTKSIMGALGVSNGGVDFNALDSSSVHIVFMVLSPEGRHDEHVKCLKYISSKMQNPIHKRFIREVGTASEIYEILAEMDEQ